MVYVVGTVGSKEGKLFNILKFIARNDMITVITPLSRDHDIGALRILLTFMS